MFYWLALLVVAAVLLSASVGWAGRVDKGSGTPPPVSSRQIAAMTRDQIQERLGQLRVTSPAVPRIEEPTCYAPMPPPGSADYVCPLCGGKTVYGRDLSDTVKNRLPGMRRRAETLRSFSAMDIRLNEAFLCKATPHEPVVKDFYLEFPRPDGGVRRARITATDLELLENFFSGRLDFESESQMAYAKERLTRLLLSEGDSF